MVAENTINAVQQLLDGAVYIETYQLSFKSIFSHDECPNLEKMQGLRTLEISVRLDWDDIQEVGDQGLREFSITKSFPFAAPAHRLYHHVEEGQPSRLLSDFLVIHSLHDPLSRIALDFFAVLWAPMATGWGTEGVSNMYRANNVDVAFLCTATGASPVQFLKNQP
ncbi:hypothetical protein B0H14DRAFT_2564298 [Mycena olivaceomarginata]|nr:hypothetical protein B0H14DRAFT_2564298 [Mycena olivaceomarginata]